MSIFSNIMGKIFGHKHAAAPTPAKPAPAVKPPAKRAPRR